MKLILLETFRIKSSERLTPFKSCTICKDIIEDIRWRCPKCRADYHKDCILASGGQCICGKKISPLKYGTKPGAKGQAAEHDLAISQGWESG